MEEQVNEQINTGSDAGAEQATGETTGESREADTPVSTDNQSVSDTSGQVDTEGTGEGVAETVNETTQGSIVEDLSLDFSDLEPERQQVVDQDLAIKNIVKEAIQEFSNSVDEEDDLEVPEYEDDRPLTKKELDEYYDKRKAQDERLAQQQAEARQIIQDNARKSQDVTSKYKDKLVVGLKSKGIDLESPENTILKQAADTLYRDLFQSTVIKLGRTQIPVLTPDETIKLSKAHFKIFNEQFLKNAGSFKSVEKQVQSSMATSGTTSMTGNQEVAADPAIAEYQAKKEAGTATTADHLRMLRKISPQN